MHYAIYIFFKKSMHTDRSSIITLQFNGQVVKEMCVCGGGRGLCVHESQKSGRSAFGLNSVSGPCI